jgi:hypothetical protein
VPVQPAFKPEAGSADCRCIENAGFVGLGLDIRPIKFLRIFADWTAYQHKTKAADQNKTAYAVHVPGIASGVFPDSDVNYEVDAQGFRLGMKLSLPFPYVEPWAGIGIGKYAWKAEYKSTDGSWVYGDDSGWMPAVTYLGGIDFKFGMGGGVFTLTPFYEFGAPYVEPTVRDIASTGKDWKDSYGTPAMIPNRWGVALGIGF